MSEASIVVRFHMALFVNVTARGWKKGDGPGQIYLSRFDGLSGCTAQKMILGAVLALGVASNIRIVTRWEFRKKHALKGGPEIAVTFVKFPKDLYCAENLLPYPSSS